MQNHPTLLFSYILFTLNSMCCRPLGGLLESTSCCTSDRIYFILYYEIENNFSHSMNPWDMSTYNIQGRIHLRVTEFHKADTLITSRNRTYYSTKNIRNKQLYFLDYGEDELAVVSTSVYNEHMINTCRYTPTMILDYFHQKKFKYLRIMILLLHTK